MYAFVNLEIVVRWEQSDRIVDVLVVENGLGDIVQRARGTTRLGN